MCEGANTQYRERLFKLIKDSALVCKEKFGGRTLLATESEPFVAKVVSCLEIIFQDGLKLRAPVSLKSVNLSVNNLTLRNVSALVSNGISMVMGPTPHSEQPVFWNFIKNHLTRHEQERYYHLQNITTDYGRGRSWLRSAINEHSLERYLKMIFSDDKLLLSFYEASSLLNDIKFRECLIETAKDLRSIIFALAIDRKELDIVEESKIVLMQSLKPEPEAIKTIKVESEPILVKPNKKTKVRVVDLANDDCKMDQEAPSTLGICIPDTEDFPSLLLPLPNITSSPSVKSLDTPEPYSHETVNNSSLSHMEMRQMLLDLSEKKKHLEETKSNLHQQLNDCRLENQDLKERCKSLQHQYNETERENVILKEQLKQYISAVNLLKNPNSNNLQTPNHDSKEEESHYEEKLIQIAEMHGELMEFNSYLQARLKSAERLANRLRADLISLRGPLPSDYLTESEVNMPSDALFERPLIHIWIPSTFLVSKTTETYHVYQIYIRIEDVEWTIYKRYSSLYKFRREMKKHYSFVSNIQFPPKKSFGHRVEKLVEERRRQLQEFLRQFLNLWTKNEPKSIPINQTNFILQLPFFK